MNCDNCDNYMTELDVCKFCHYEPSSSDEDWDILNLEIKKGWLHSQIQDRLYDKGIKCWSVDIWFDNDVAYIIHANASSEEIAEALGVNMDCVYNDHENGLIILNLFKEKYIRGMIE